MQHYAAFHLGLHCLPKYPLSGFSNTKVITFKKYYVCFACISFFPLRNSVDTDEMQHYAAFHLGFYCLPKYPLNGFRIQRVKKNVC